MRWAPRGSSAPRIDEFEGRQVELARLERLVGDDHTRIVAIRAIGGMGKTWLARRFYDSVASRYDVHAWVTLVNDADPASCVRRILEATASPPAPDADLAELIDTLASVLSENRALVIIDNFESALIAAGQDSRVKDAYEELLWMVAAHPLANVALTTRETPSTLDDIGSPRAQTLVLGGLDRDSVIRVLAKRDISGTDADIERLVRLYAGHPQMLRLAAATVQTLGGDLDYFLEHEATAVTHEVDMFEWHVARLSSEGLQVLYWLAILREPTSLKTVLKHIWPPLQASTSELLKYLRDREVVQWDAPDVLSLQPAFMAFVTQRLVSGMIMDLAHFGTQHGELDLAEQFALGLGTVPPNIRECQTRELIRPVIDGLVNKVGTRDRLGIELHAGIEQLRTSRPLSTGYAAVNLVLLISSTVGTLDGLNLSDLTLRYWDVSEMTLQDVDLSRAQLVECRFASTFGNMLSVAASPVDGSIAAAGTDNGVWVWGPGAQHATVRVGHTNWVRGVAFSPNGQQLASVSSDGTLRVWSPLDTDIAQLLTVASKRLWSVTWLDDGVIATGDDDGHMHFIDTSTKVVTSEKAHASRIETIVQVSDSAVLSGGPDGLLILWSAGDLQPTARLDLGCPIVALDHDPAAATAVAAHPTGGLAIISIAGSAFGAVTRCTPGADATSVTLLGDLGTAVVGHLDGSLSWVELQTGRVMLRRSGHAARITDLSRWRDQVISAAEDQTVRVWAGADGQVLRKVVGGLNHAWSVGAWNAGDGIETIVSGHEDRTIRLWRRAQHTSQWEQAQVLRGHTNRIWSLRINEQSALMASASEDCSARVWDLTTGRCTQVLAAHGGAVWGVDLVRSHDLVVTAGDEGVVRAWSTHDGRLAWQRRLSQRRIRALASGPLGDWIVAAGEDDHVHVLSPDDGAVVSRLGGHTDRVNAIDVLSDTRVVTAGRDGRVIVWDIAQRIATRVFEPPQSAGFAWAVAGHDRGEWVAAGCEDGSIHVWDLSTGEKRWAVRHFAARVKWLTAMSSGAELVACAEDGQIRQLDLPSGEVVGVASSPRIYEGTRIDGTAGLDDATREVLHELGAKEGVRVPPVTLAARGQTKSVVTVSGSRPRVFISYSREDSGFAGQLARHLRNMGADAFFDIDTIDYGSRFETVIRSAIEASRAFVLLMTPASEQSKWVTRERLFAEECGLPVFPLLVDGDVFFGLRDIHYEDVRHSGWPSDRFFAVLARTLELSDREAQGEPLLAED